MLIFWLNGRNIDGHLNSNILSDYSVLLSQKSWKLKKFFHAFVEKFNTSPWARHLVCMLCEKGGIVEASQDFVYSISRQLSSISTWIKKSFCSTNCACQIVSRVGTYMRCFYDEYLKKKLGLNHDYYAFFCKQWSTSFVVINNFSAEKRCGQKVWGGIFCGVK